MKSRAEGIGRDTARATHGPFRAWGLKRAGAGVLAIAVLALPGCDKILVSATEPVRTSAGNVREARFQVDMGRVYTQVHTTHLNWLVEGYAPLAFDAPMEIERSGSGRSALCVRGTKQCWRQIE